MVILEITVVKSQRERERERIERERDYIIPVRGERESDRQRGGLEAYYPYEKCWLVCQCRTGPLDQTSWNGGLEASYP